MLTPREQLFVGLLSLKRLAQGHLNRLSHPQNQDPQSSLDHTQGLLDDLIIPDSDVKAVLPLRDFMRQTGSLVTYNVVLGACDDMMPLQFDLTNPAPGSILIIGDPGSGKTHLLKAILRSAQLSSPPPKTQFYIMAQKPGEYEDLAFSTHCQDIMNLADTNFNGLVEFLVTLAEERRTGERLDPAIILAIDGLLERLKTLDSEVFTRLYWLIKHGPRARIWTIATLPAEITHKLNDRLLGAFRTQLFGYIDSPNTRRALLKENSEILEGLTAGEQFCVAYNEEILVFQVCDFTE